MEDIKPETHKRSITAAANLALPLERENQNES
jgi:hypothetical protein